MQTSSADHAHLLAGIPQPLLWQQTCTADALLATLRWPTAHSTAQLLAQQAQLSALLAMAKEVTTSLQSSQVCSPLKCHPAEYLRQFTDNQADWSTVVMMTSARW